MCTGKELLLSFLGGAQVGNAAYQGRMKEEEADRNAAIVERQGADDKDAAVAQAGKIRKAAQRQAAEANANLAAAGVSIGEGTPVRINEEIYANSEKDAYSVLLSGDRKERSAHERAQFIRWQGKNARNASLLASASSIASGWYSGGGGA